MPSGPLDTEGIKRARAGGKANLGPRNCLPVVPCPGDSCDLDYDPDDEDGHGNENAVFSGDGLGNEPRQESPQPSTELENGSEPSLLGLVCLRVDGVVLAHVCDTRSVLHLTC